MASNRIHQLAKAYWAGESSLAEEAELFAALRAEPQADPELAALREYAQFVGDTRVEGTLPFTFEADLMAEINQRASQPTKVRYTQPWKPWLMRSAAAVGVLLSLTTAWYLFEPSPTPAPQATVIAEADTFEDPQEAYEEVRKALLKMSAKMNDGMEHTRILSTFHSTQEAMTQRD